MPSDARAVAPILAALVIAGCSSAGPLVQGPRGAIPAPTHTPVDLPAAARHAAPAPMLIRRGALGLDVDEVAPPVARTHALVVSVGGYVEREEHQDRSADLTLRVPEPKLDAAMDTLAGLGTVTSRASSSRDVSQETIDVEARLRTLAASRDRLRDLLSRATTVSEVITVEHELARVQGELESLQGRLEQLRASSALAELSVSFHQRVILGPLGKVATGFGRFIKRLFVIR
jgi:hypothetical protein